MLEQPVAAGHAVRAIEYVQQYGYMTAMAYFYFLLQLIGIEMYCAPPVIWRVKNHNVFIQLEFVQSYFELVFSLVSIHQD